MTSWSGQPPRPRFAPHGVRPYCPVRAVTAVPVLRPHRDCRRYRRCRYLTPLSPLRTGSGRFFTSMLPEHDVRDPTVSKCDGGYRFFRHTRLATTARAPAQGERSRPSDRAPPSPRSACSVLPEGRTRAWAYEPAGGTSASWRNAVHIRVTCPTPGGSWSSPCWRPGGPNGAGMPWTSDARPNMTCARF